MSFDPLEQTLQACAEIEQLLKNDYPRADPGRVTRIRFLSAQLTGNSYIREKAGNLASSAERFYSARKHASYPGGADALMSHMRHRCLKSIRDEVQTLKNGLLKP